MIELIPYLLGFLTVFLGVPVARKYLMASGIYGVDQQKEDKPKIPTSGGLVVLFGFLISVTSFLGLNQLFEFASVQTSLLLAALNSVTIIALIGLIDDIHIDLEKMMNEHVEEEITVDFELGDVHVVEKIFRSFTADEDAEEMHRKGISKVPKMLFVLPAVFPLIAVGAGSWTMQLPIIGTVNWGLVYPLFLLPIGLLFVSNVVNMLAGMNGLSASMSLVAALGMGIYATWNGELEAAVLAFSLSVSLAGFLYYNLYPASILPGDSLTYLAGAGLFSTMVIGNFEKFGVFIFTPWFLEFFLKLRSRFGAHSWGEINSDGTLEPKYDKNYSLTHPLMRRGLNERQILYVLVGLEVLIVSAGLWIFRQGLV